MAKNSTFLDDHWKIMKLTSQINLLLNVLNNITK